MFVAMVALRRHVLCWLAALLLPSVVVGQTDVTDLRRTDSIVRAQADSGFSGVVLVARGDSVLLRQAYAPRAERLSADASFWIASITKSFTAAAVLRLQEEGRLALTDSIARFLPGVPADKRSITIHQLLTHTAGLGGEYTGGGVTDRSRAVRAILAQELIHKPGDGYKYGDDDYELLAAIIEVATGRSWEDVVQERLVRPAGLRDVGFACRANTNTRRPVGRAARAARSGAPISRVACDWGHKGANGMSATADDLLKWTQALRAGGLLGAAGNGALYRPQIFVRREPPFDVSYGYGVRLYALNNELAEVTFLGSGDDDHTAAVRILRSGLTIIVLSNAGHHAGTTWSSFIARQLASRE